MKITEITTLASTPCQSLYQQVRSTGAVVRRKTIHPNSRANLRPPWQKGESGNPAGRRKGCRNRRSLRAEKIGKKVLHELPHLIDRLERLAIASYTELLSATPPCTLKPSQNQRPRDANCRLEVEA